MTVIWVKPTEDGFLQVQEQSRWNWHKVCVQDAIRLDDQYDIEWVRNALYRLDATLAIQYPTHVVFRFVAREQEAER